MRTTIRIGLTLVISCLGLFAVAQAPAQNLAQANSQSNTKVHTTTTTVITKESDEPVPEPTKSTPTPAPAHSEAKENVKTATFGTLGLSGTAGCKTEELSKGAVSDLKGDCKAWIKDQKADLKDKYLTGSCDEVCEDCGMSLRRCAVKGTVHYVIH